MKKPLSLVLLIDDDETTNFINKRVIDKAGIAAQIEVAMNGKEGLLALKRLSADATSPQVPDIIFVDIRMSVMDGYGFLDEYRNLEPHQKARILVVLSSSASFYDLQKLADYTDVKKHIAKPLDEFELRDILAEHFPEYLDS